MFIKRITYFFGFFKACECKEDGSVDGRCDDNGKCSCNPNVCGDKCDKCCPGYDNYPACDKCANEYHSYPHCKSIWFYFLYFSYSF